MVTPGPCTESWIQSRGRLSWYRSTCSHRDQRLSRQNLSCDLMNQTNHTWLCPESKSSVWTFCTKQTTLNLSIFGFLDIYHRSPTLTNESNQSQHFPSLLYKQRSKHVTWATNLSCWLCSFDNFIPSCVVRPFSTKKKGLFSVRVCVCHNQPDKKFLLRCEFAYAAINSGPFVWFKAHVLN